MTLLLVNAAIGQSIEHIEGVTLFITRRRGGEYQLYLLFVSEVVVQPPPHNIVSVRGSENHTTELHENVGEDFRISGSSDYDLETHKLPRPPSFSIK